METQNENDYSTTAGEFASGNDHYLTGRDNWFDELVEHGIDEQTAIGADSLLGKDTVLGNVDSHEAEALRLLSKNIVEYIEAEHPPEGSAIQGPIRAAMLGSSQEDLYELRAEQRTNLRTAQIAYELRLSRSVGGFQQKRMGEQRNVSELEDNREGQDGDRGGIMDRVGGLFT